MVMRDDYKKSLHIVYTILKSLLMENYVYISKVPFFMLIILVSTKSKNTKSHTK